MEQKSWGGKRTGAGRKATGRSTVNISLSLSQYEAELLKNRAKESNMSVSRFVCKYLRLDTLPDNLTGNTRRC